MLTDSTLFELNSLVQGALASGASPKKALELLHDELKNGPYAVSADELPFDSSQAKRGIPHHVMLDSWATARKPLHWVYRSLSGSGTHYNGMWGDIHGDLALIPEDAAARVKSGDAPADSICEQVVLCLRLLAASSSSVLPDTAKAVRRHLSELFLQYPVLLHPAVMAPLYFEYERPEYGSLLYLLSKTPHGGLPRYSHFEEDDGQVPLAQMPNQELVARLTAFARHPCVQAALTRAPMRVCLNKKSDSILSGKDNLIEAMTSVMGPRVQFLASIMETEELARPVGPNVTRPLPFAPLIPKPTTRAASMDAESKERSVLSALSSATMAASGLVHLVTTLNTVHRGLRTWARDARLLADVRARMPVLCGLNKEKSQFGQMLRDSMLRRVFLRQQSLPLEELVQNTKRMAQGLVDSGFSNSLPEAAHFVADAVLGHDRAGSNLPSVDVAGAVAFIKAVDEMGGFGEGEQALSGMRRVLGAVRDYPAHEIPHRADWESAFRVVATEKTMVGVMEAQASLTQASMNRVADLPAASNDVLPGATHTTAAAHDAPAAPLAPVRRPRAAI